MHMDIDDSDPQIRYREIKDLLGQVYPATCSGASVATPSGGDDVEMILSNMSWVSSG